MLNEYNQVGFVESSEGKIKLKAFSTVTKEYLPGEFIAATIEEIEAVADKAKDAFLFYSKKNAEEKAGFLEAIGDEIMAIGDELIKMLVPVGPVLVFGASNFPFAFSTAGGDTASALAAGNPVIVKAHEGHLGTNELMASAIKKAAKKTNMPDGVFSFVISSDVETIQHLVKHEAIKAIGFTGSYKAGTAIFKTASTGRKTPIPVYAEMSSINPVVLLPKKLEQDSNVVATQLAASVTLGTGQFCTNPGLVFLIEKIGRAHV